MRSRRTLERATKRFLTTVLRLRCPVRAEGHIAKGAFIIKDTCEVCGAHFERGDCAD